MSALARYQLRRQPEGLPNCITEARTEATAEVTTEVTAEGTAEVTSEVTTGNVTGNTITLTPEQLQVIIKNAVAEAIKEVVPLLLENKQPEQVTTPVTKVTTPDNLTKPVITGSNYLDDIPTFLSKK